jgi:hypothetical protein
MTAKLTKEMHVHLSDGDHSALKAWADKECRSANAQRQFYYSRDNEMVIRERDRNRSKVGPMATIAFTSAAWMLGLMGAAAVGNADDNGAKLAIGLWFGTAAAACMYGAVYYS